MVRVAIAFLALMLLVSAARAEKRIALLIGNQGYGSEIGRLANPHNDVALLEKSLKGLGFEVATVRDAGLAALTTAVNAYARRVQAAGPNVVGFFYYSGHGAADAGTNYLIPVDVKTTETGELWDQSLRLTEITRKLKTEAGNATHFVVFDACRNTLKLTRAGSRAIVQSKGFVPVAQESGMLIAYATAEGELASDVGAGAGPYAKVLAEEIVKPGVEAVVMFRVVQRRVRAAISQEPYLGFNAMGDVYLAGAEAPKPPDEVGPAWAAVKDTASTAMLEAFVERYKSSFYADLALLRIEELKRLQATSVSGQELIKLTIPEGLTSPQIVELLRQNSALSGTLYDPPPPEGSLLPDTYAVPPGTLRDEVIQRIQDARHIAVMQLWENRGKDLPLTSHTQLVILASIVEKEAARPDDRARVAAVLVNRLKKSIKLQSDATLIYGITGGKGPFERALTRSDLTRITPFNTYLIDGLPPSPICNPSREALAAAANPARTNELYFAPDGTGGLSFAETLSQHQSNLEKVARTRR